MLSSYFILGAIILSLVLMQVNQRLASPALAILERWLRWLIFAAGGARICVDLGWIDRPFWTLAIVFFLFWLLGQTLYNWLGIHALSVSPLPLFPRYSANQSGEEWPVQPRLLRIRDWLRANGFKQVQALRAEVGGGIYLRVSVYQDAEAKVRVQVTFLPLANGAISVCYALTSVTAQGSRFVTDNLYIPFGGFYPEDWFVERHPLWRSLAHLVARHQRRVAASAEVAVPFTNDPAADLNASQHELDALNTELGFLHSPGEREERGKITYEGRYRIWKEIWLLNYFGIAGRY
ncbi:hypothetical protein K0B96_17175 [Horticoccus luteus]|uniref:Uncharacterized protein n=1 Tax=Horticoccus luteus TaxID=2862869 RepID=A0A8F9XGB9_9BACT|nr:hypothetical protein [Horticoccus luteus]QYM79012.1 hypothetical protein K0B96_17175 [Horticoccus luteus]